MPSRPDLRRTAGAVALSRARLRATSGGRAARLGAWATAIGFAAVAVAARATDGRDAALSGTVVSAAHWIAWLAGAPLALAAADERGTVDRREGMVALAAARGVSSRGLAGARTLAGMVEIATGIGVPLLALALLTVALAGRFSDALDRGLLALGAAVFAIVAGVTLGTLSAACARLGGERARLLLVTIVVVPWMLADLFGHRALSIPGALDAVLEFALRVRSTPA